MGFGKKKLEILEAEEFGLEKIHLERFSSGSDSSWESGNVPGYSWRDAEGWEWLYPMSRELGRILPMETFLRKCLCGAGAGEEPGGP